MAFISIEAEAGVGPAHDSVDESFELVFQALVASLEQGRDRGMRVIQDHKSMETQLASLASLLLAYVRSF